MERSAPRWRDVGRGPDAGERPEPSSDRHAARVPAHRGGTRDTHGKRRGSRGAAAHRSSRYCACGEPRKRAAVMVLAGRGVRRLAVMVRRLRRLRSARTLLARTRRARQRTDGQHEREEEGGEGAEARHLRKSAPSDSGEAPPQSRAETRWTPGF